MRNTRRALAACLVLIVCHAAQAGAVPVKLNLKQSIENGFEFPESVAVGPSGNLYVADRGNNRVQELTPSGQFVLMFGKEVNATKDAVPGATAGEKNVCTATSGDTCKAGVPGSGAGEFREVQSLTVDPSSGNVYAQDISDWRVEEFTAGGEFVLMFGKEVNRKGGDVCTSAEASECQAGQESAEGSTEHGAFKFLQFAGNDLAVSVTPEHLLYVGDEQRIQKFSANGEWKGEMPLSALEAGTHRWVQGLALDESDDVYVIYGEFDHAIVVHKLGPSGEPLTQMAVNPPTEGHSFYLEGLALDVAGHLAVTANDTTERKAFGVLLDSASGQVTQFGLPGTAAGIVFDSVGQLYVAAAAEIAVYEPLDVAELVIRETPSGCAPGPFNGTDATLECELLGQINPEGVSETEVWFKWGRTPALGSETPKQPVPPGSTLVPVSAKVVVRPNDHIYYQLAARDANVEPPEILESPPPPASFTTPLAPPWVSEKPIASFVTASSALLFSQLNPENASTAYRFQYGPCEKNSAESCSASPYVAETKVLHSNAYAKIGTTAEVTGLQPSTWYHARLVIDAENSGKTEKAQTHGNEVSFETDPLPVPAAETGGTSSVTTTTATLFGIVNSSGQPSTYAFEIGLDEGASTRYEPVVTGSVDGFGPVPETVQLTDLQPGAVYKYRIVIQNGFGRAEGATMTFETSPMPEIYVAPAPPQLAVPRGKFPPEASKCKKGFARDSHGKCVKVKVKHRHRKVKHKKKK